MNERNTVFQVDFDIKRIYFIYSVVQGSKRGFHAHKHLRQYLLCPCGRCTIEMSDAEQTKTALLDNKMKGLFVGPSVWREMYNFSEDAVLTVLASDYYDESDYIRDYDIFLKYIEERKK